MPMQSQAQRAAMHAAAQGHSTLGIPKKVGKEFVKADPGGKLPGHVKKMAHGGVCPNCGYAFGGTVKLPDWLKKKPESESPEHGFAMALMKRRHR